MGQPTSTGEVRQFTLDIERKYGLPEGTLYKQADIESSFGKHMLSPKGARGWFGFMPATAREYGLADPDDFASSADAAGRKMRDLLKKHDGNLDYALVDYNGGGKAVSALRAGKPWQESAGYLAKFHGKTLEEIAGRTSLAPIPMGEQFTSQVTHSSSVVPLASEFALAQRQREATYGGLVNGVSSLPTAIRLGFETQNTVYNFFKDQGVSSASTELFDWNTKEAQALLSEFPANHWRYLLQGTTPDGVNLRAQRLREVMEKEKALGNMGLGPALIGGIVGGLPDLPTLLAFVPTAGAASFLTRASRLANVARLGLMGGASNVAYDSVMNQFKPTATVDDLYVSGLFGLGLGALSGGLVSPRRMGVLGEDLERLRQWGLAEGKKGLERELEEFAGRPGMKPPEGWSKGIDDWLNNRPGKAPEVPPVGIIREGPSTPPPRPVIDEGRLSPLERPEPPARAPGDVPAKNPTGKPWDEQWDKPIRRNNRGAPDILDLPPLRKVSHLADYVRAYSANPDIVALMDRALKGIDLRKLRFDVVDPRVRLDGLNVDSSVAQKLNGAYGLVSTPHGSSGEGIQLALRGYGWGRDAHGLNEETFVHELLHAATVYKMLRVQSGKTQGMHPKSVQAIQELEKLHKDVSAIGIPPRFQTQMSDSFEFISYGLTQRPFQEWLKSINVDGPKTTLWTRFTEGLRKLLGMSPSEGTAYAKLIDLSDHLLRKSGIENKPKVTPQSFEPAGEHITKADIAAADASGIPPVFGWGLGLEHKLMNKKLPPSVRSLASKLFGTTVGHKGHAVVERNAWDETIQRAEGWTADMRKTTYAAFGKWFDASGRKFHEKAEAFEEFGTLVGNYVRGFEGDFPAEVKQAGNHLRKLYADVADEINNPAKRSGGMKRGLTETEVLDEVTGERLWVGKLEKNANYLPRKHDARKWDEMVRIWGRDAVEGWWANAFRKANPERTSEDASKWAGWYVRTVEEAHMNRSADHLEEMMTGYDEKALLESLIRNGGFTEAQGRQVIRDMFKDPSSDAGRTASSLRHRNTVNETHSERWKKGDEDVEVTLNDFIQSNALDISESYFRRTASSIALADRLDIYKQSDIGRLIDDATAKTFGQDGFSEAAAVQAKKDLKFAVDRIQGIPQEEFSTLNKAMAQWRDFNVIRLMGGAVWNQVTELSQIVGSMGWKATLGAVGELRALRRDIATGKAPHDFLDHLENTIGGVGSEYVARLDFSPKDDWVRYKGDTAMNRRLDALDSGTKKVAKGVLDYTGMTGTMIQQKRIHAIALMNHFVNAATGEPSKFLSKERLAWMGMSEADYAALNKGIAAHTKGAVTGDFGKKTNFDFKAFAKESPELNSMLMNALHRETRRVVQENDLASMVPLMGTTLGKTVFQFMNFSIHGWNKSMLFAMNHRDFSTLSTVLHGSFFASLAYMGRTHLSAMGMDDAQREEYLAKRMSTKQIVANSFGRISQASLLPTAYDTTLGNFTGAMFAGTRTTSDVTSFASNPTLQAVNGVLSLGKMVRNAASDDLQTTQRDVKTWGKLIPLNNTALVSPFLNALANDFPTNEDATK
ncbi:transglycosylase SLT domain-containing protein [Variovorax sp.]|uniref:transglycosylase SLT domain-containing protein n=1 Tax=Variovorax sp. TaxID=1871043 RepID=UPI000C4877D1|nr:transglycosylase SLT domain-containing protein [Variovorax sp.]MBS75186.1 lytic transglycosylase [Variovorax sp.]